MKTVCGSMELEEQSFPVCISITLEKSQKLGKEVDLKTTPALVKCSFHTREQQHTRCCCMVTSMFELDVMNTLKGD